MRLSEMAAAVDNFVDWLGNKLKDLNTDENIFGSYITGILDSDETEEEKNEALQGILSEIVEDFEYFKGIVYLLYNTILESNITQICQEIIEMWLKFKPKEPLQTVNSLDVDAKLAKLLESQCLATTKQKEYTDEEKKIREAILSQYSQMSDDEEENVEVAAAGDAHKSENGLEKNTNVLSVQQAEKERREQAKLESQRKKEKDKEDR
ncbi:coiled-coil domain-containing protein 43 [Holotrichia oblita]|uniref:Coiled-coil domain-containing protein 43 n=1 Tax=Holotrichia oblita TaxID=644536 RepID=A0ACB9TCY2_HOLOL|nr:coiled-coil domain-containing protein 43 [Holotrichia oblita]